MKYLSCHLPGVGGGEVIAAMLAGYFFGHVCGPCFGVHDMKCTLSKVGDNFSVVQLVQYGIMHVNFCCPTNTVNLQSNVIIGGH